MEKEAKRTAQIVAGLVNGRFRVSTLSSMKPGELFRFAAELASKWDVKARATGLARLSRRYVE